MKAATPYHRLFGTAALFILVLVGCAHNNAPAPGTSSDLFRTIRPSAKTIATYKPAAPPEEKPLVKIISGSTYTSMDEAHRRMAAANQRPLGMRQDLKRLIMRKVPLRFLTEQLSEVGGFNVIATQAAAEKKVDVYLRDLTMRGAVEALCRLNGLWYREDDRIVTLMTAEEYSQEMVVHRDEKTRAYYMRYANAQDMAGIIQAVMGAQVEYRQIQGEKVYGHLEADSSSGGNLSQKETKPPLSGEEKKKLLALGLSEKTGDAVELAAMVGKSLPATITVFRRSNCIIARSLDETLLTEIGRLIETLDTPSPQVLLEIKILSLTLGDGFESFFKFDWANTGATSSQSLGSLPESLVSGQTLSYAYIDDHLNLQLSLYEREGRARLLNTPFLMSANNAEVKFFVGVDTPIREDVTSKTTYVGEQARPVTTFEIKIKREELGTDLTLSTFINEDRTVTLDVEAEISTIKRDVTTVGVPDDETGQIYNFGIDGVDKTEIESIFVAAPGQSIAIGGFIKEEVHDEFKKVPILGDVPGLGFFFKDVVKSTQKEEIVIILTPHVIPHPSQAGGTSADFLQRRSSHPQVVEEKETIIDYPKHEERKTHEDANTEIR